jgi:putative RecB family exonuclease
VKPNANFPKDHISVSQINLYLMCPLKYRFTYIDLLPRPFKPAAFAFGSAIHSAIEWWHKKRMEGRDPNWRDVSRVFAADFNAQQADNIAYKDGESEADFVDKGKSMLAVYLKEYSGAPPKAVEMPFRVHLVDQETGEMLELPLDGYMDLVESDDTVVDLKTAARSYSEFDVSQHLQLTAYSYAYEQLYSTRPKLRLDCLLKTAKPRFVPLPTEREQDDHVRFFHIAKGVTDAIRSEHFYPCPGWQCKDCEFFKPCQTWRTNREPHAEPVASEKVLVPA